MIVRMTALAALTVGMLGVMKAATIPLQVKEQKAKAQEQAKARKALQEVQEFVGQWNLEGTQKAGGKVNSWKEKVSWGWRFKDGDAWIVADFAEGKGKYFTAGVLRYDVPKKKYQLTLTAADKTEQLFEGDLGKTGGLQLDHKNAKTGDVHRLVLNTLDEGNRLQVKYQRQEGGKGPFAEVFAMNGNNGTPIAGGAKKPECIVSGGAANIAVQVAGKTYYVCCTGCRDELLANPDKYTK